MHFRNGIWQTVRATTRSDKLSSNLVQQNTFNSYHQSSSQQYSILRHEIAQQSPQEESSPSVNFQEETLSSAQSTISLDQQAQENALLQP